MPIYEYQCIDCDTEFQELVLSRSAEVEIRCKSCNSGNVTKLLSGSAVKSSSSSVPSYSPPSGGGGCGGGCSCH